MKTQKRTWWPSGCAESMSQDDGFAMAMAIAVAAIVFMLATTLITLTVYRTQQTQLQTRQTISTHMADAGLNAYIAEMRFNANYVQNHPSPLTGTQDAGSWTVSAVQVPGKAEATLTAVGTVGGTSRTLHARIAFVGFGDYAMLTNSTINFTSTDIVNGDVRANGNIRLDNLTRIYGYATTAGVFKNTGGSTITPTSAQVRDGSKAGADPIVFNTASANAASMQASATADVTNFAAGGVGHLLVFGSPSRGLVTVKTITSINTTDDPGHMTFGATTTIPYPSSGCFAFADDAWVMGTYSEPVSVYSTGNIFFAGDLLSSDPSDPTITCGVMAKNNVLFPTWSAESPDTLNVRTATLAQTGQVCYDNKSSYYTAWANDGVFKCNVSQTTNRNSLYTAVNPASVGLAPGVTVTIKNRSTGVSKGTRVITAIDSGGIYWATGNISVTAADGVYAQVGDDLRAQLNFTGAMATYGLPYTQDADPSNHGYTAATINYDTNLYQTAPPQWPPIGTGEIKVISWLDY